MLSGRSVSSSQPSPLVWTECSFPTRQRAIKLCDYAVPGLRPSGRAGQLALGCPSSSGRKNGAGRLGVDGATSASRSEGPWAQGKEHKGRVPCASAVMDQYLLLRRVAI